jgi:hypothetical protein
MIGRVIFSSHKNYKLQVERLRVVLNEEVEIHGRENFPTLRITLHKLIVLVRRYIFFHHN